MELSSISAQVLFAAAKRKHLKVEIISKRFNLLKLSVGEKYLYIKATSFSVNPQPSCIISNNKYLTKKVLERNKISIPKSWLVTTPAEAKKLSKNLNIYPCVIKPVRGSHGNKVFANIQNAKEFNSLLPFIFTSVNPINVLIEEYITGKDYRLLVVKSEVVAVIQRVPAHVIGDGTSTIAQLIKVFNKNPLVGEKYERPMCKIVLDQEVKRSLKKLGINFLYVPFLSETIFLRQNANISTGGISIDVTDKIPQFIKDIAIKATESLGMVISGVDIIYNSETNKAYVLEVNDTPGIDIHHYPIFGKSRMVADNIIDCLVKSLG